MFSCEFYEFFWNNFFYRPPPVAAFLKYNPGKTNVQNRSWNSFSWRNNMISGSLSYYIDAYGKRETWRKLFINPTADPLRLWYGLETNQFLAYNWLLIE